MNYNKNPLTPHLQVYRWQISSLLSITHRIVGVLNFLLMILFCSWLILIFLNQDFLVLGKEVFASFFGNFIILSVCWTFSFFVLNEIRHLVWDLGYGFDVKISKISGFAVLIGSFILAVIIYKFGGFFL
mgnify:FL=1|tara:strand:+ start:4080 stop:4466 length:387 start_codon:yes stop_codon:yes gene_type:complete